MTKLTETFLDLIAIDEVHPNEKEVLAYITSRLKKADITYKTDSVGNIVAVVPGSGEDVLGICGHVDIAAPLNDRKVIVEGDIIKTDGTGLLGGDDKTAVAAMLELVDWLHDKDIKPSRTIELIFTVGEESGLVGATNFGIELQCKDMLVLDWSGAVNHIIVKSPAYYKLDVTFKGVPAHPAEWQNGVNAGAALMKAASALKQGEYAEGVTFNIGLVDIGAARNQVPGSARLCAELRSHSTEAIDAAADALREHFTLYAQGKLTVEVELIKQSQSYTLNRDSQLHASFLSTLQELGLKPEYDETFGCFDGNVFYARDINVVIAGAGYYHPHSPSEYVNSKELEQVLTFLQKFVC